MRKTIERLKALLSLGSEYFSESIESEIVFRLSPEKWSKKEILGHLIDSGVNNLQRFTEIQFESKPYNIRKYNQDKLVKVNDYQNSETNELVTFWLSINKRIIKVMSLQTEATLGYEIALDKGNISDLRFLMNDYVDHMEHHLKQITKK